jgi:lipoprotein NlpI
MSQAREDFQKAVALSPNDALVWNNKGFFHYKMQELDTALDCYKRALKLTPSYREAQYNLNLALQKKGAPEIAEVSSNPADSSFVSR